MNTLRWIITLFRSNWISLAGAVTTTMSVLAMAMLFLLQEVGVFKGAYIGLVLFLVLPVFFVLGLLAIPLGLYLYRRNLKDRLAALRDKPFRLVRVLTLLTAINIIIVGVAGYQGAHYMDSVEFCGKLCHEVMKPQYEAYLRSPHARVACVDCHIGPGASWFVKSKLSGVRQIFAVLGQSYPRPIPTPVADLRPARDTCEQCHWPEKFTGDRLVVRQHFGYDREATPYANVLVLKTGGLRPDGEATGIHWHIRSGIEVTYRAVDRERTEIPWVKLVDHKTGREEIFTVDGVAPDSPPEGEVRTMDCIDCHNQPSHVYERSWEALNESMAAGLISRKLPFIKKVAREALEQKWDPGEAEAGIRGRLGAFYSDEEPLDADTRELLEPAVQEVVSIHRRNIYPEMNIHWNTYRSFAGHLGCQRCHDDEHRTAAGRTIPLSCETCHAVLSFRQRNPEILESLGIEHALTEPAAR